MRKLKPKSHFYPPKGNTYPCASKTFIFINQIKPIIC